MANQTELANKALILCGSDARISTLADDTSANGKNLRTLWNQARDAMLEEKLWKFAKRRWTLPAATTGPLHGPKYRYVRPGDCVKAWRLEESKHGHPPPPFDREEDAIATDIAPPLYIIGTARIENTAAWDAMFADAFAYRLAAELADTKTGSAGRAKGLLDEYYKKIREARWAGSIEAERGERPAGSFRESRRLP